MRLIGWLCVIGAGPSMMLGVLMKRIVIGVLCSAPSEQSGSRRCATRLSTGFGRPSRGGFVDMCLPFRRVCYFQK